MRGKKNTVASPEDVSSCCKEKKIKWQIFTKQIKTISPHTLCVCVKLTGVFTTQMANLNSTPNWQSCRLPDQPHATLLEIHPVTTPLSEASFQKSKLNSSAKS